MIPDHTMLRIDLVDIKALGLGIFLDGERFSLVTRLCGITLLTIVAGVLLSSLHEYKFSPLARVPGPAAASISRLPQFLATITGRQLPWLIKLHEQYGGVVRIGPNTVSFTEAQAWKDICGSTKYAKDGLPKPPDVAAMIGGELLNPDPNRPRREQPHGIMRNAMAFAQKPNNVKKYEPLIYKYLEEWLAEFGKSCNETGTADIGEASSFFICNLFFDLFLGESLDLFKDPEYRAWVHSPDRFVKVVTVLSLLARFPWLNRPLLYAVRRWGDGERASFLRPIHERFDRRVRSSTPRDDMLQMLLRQEGINEGRNTMPLPMLREFAPFLILGACDPIPGVIAATLFFAFRQRGRYIGRRLVSEVREAFPSEDSITLEQLSNATSKLPYLQACLQETFRRYTTGVGAERVVPQPGAEIAGYFIPGGTVVVMEHQPTYLLEKHFHCPFEYYPERWLQPKQGRLPAFDNDSWHIVYPFSTGPSSCPGQE